MRFGGVGKGVLRHVIKLSMFSVCRQCRIPTAILRNGIAATFPRGISSTATVLAGRKKKSNPPPVLSKKKLQAKERRREQKRALLRKDPYEGEKLSLSDAINLLRVRNS